MDRRNFLVGFLPAGNRTSASGMATDDTIRQAPQSARFKATPSLDRYDGPWDRKAVAHLLRRTIIAPSHQEMEEAMTIGMDDLIIALTARSLDIPKTPDYIHRWMDVPTAYFDSSLVWMLATFYDEMRRWWCSLMMNRGFSVRERMTLFWHNHFSGDATSIHEPRYMYLQNQMFRRYALGNFKDLVREITTDRAMLIFLDGRENKKGKEINENYARELQELFTIGVSDNNGKPNYTQKDIEEAARVLTGWGWWGPGITGEVSCPPWFGHDPTDKVVYGTTIKGREHGEEELDDLLDIIFDREETPRHIIRKLYRFFVYTDAPLTPFTPIASEIEENIIIPLASEFRASNWNISHVLRRLFSSKHFYDPEIIATTIKSPIDLLVGTARALSTGNEEEDSSDFLMEAIHTRTQKLGQWILVPPGVQGWQWYRTWISSTTLPLRHSFTDELIAGVQTHYLHIGDNLEEQPERIEGIAKLDVLSYAQQFRSFDNDVHGFIETITEHLLAYPASPGFQKQLCDVLLQGIPEYEWESIPASTKKQRLCDMMKILMRSAHYQLM